MYQLDRVMTTYIKLVGGQEYPYIEVAVTQQEALYGFYLEILSNSLALAASPSSVLIGFEAMDPVAEAAANTFYDATAAAATKRILGDVNLDFTALLTNRVFVQPGAALGAATLPDVLPPIFGLYIKTDGLKINRVFKTRGG